MPLPSPRNAAATRERLLACARSCFLHDSYDAVGLREIAGAAGVDVALIGRYFGSKEQLFRAVLGKDDEQWDELAQADDLAAHLASMFAADNSQDAEHIERLLIMLRSAASPTASSIVQSVFRNEVLEPFARVLSGPRAEMRAAMALAVLMGTTIVRTIMKAEKAYECESNTFRDRLLGMLRVALATDPDAMPEPSTR
jgi:AcrR family transcriptional regulator